MRNALFLTGILLIAFLSTLAGAVGTHAFEHPAYAATYNEAAVLELASLKAPHAKGITAP